MTVHHTIIGGLNDGQPVCECGGFIAPDDMCPACERSDLCACGEWRGEMDYCRYCRGEREAEERADFRAGR